MVGMDKVEFVIPSNQSTEQSINKLRQSLQFSSVSLNNHEHIVYNQHHSSISKINNYLVGNQMKYEDVTIVTVYGISQVYYSTQTISDDHQAIMRWAASHNAQIIGIDVCYDNYHDYNLSISNYNNSSDQLNQNNYDINYMTKFPTHSIYVPLDGNDKVIKVIRTKIINNQVLSDEVKGTSNYYQYNYYDNTNLYKEFKKTSKKEATHLKLSLKESKSYFIYLNIIKEHNLNVEYHKTNIDDDVIILSSNLKIDIINYDKYEWDKKNGNKEAKIISHYKQIAKEQYTDVSYRRLRQNRVELRRCYKDDNLVVTPQTVDEIIEFISNDIKKISKKISVTIFKSKTAIYNYQRALRKYNKQKAINKYTRNINIDDYGKTLSIEHTQIDKMMNNLKECLTVEDDEIVIDEAPTRVKPTLKLLQSFGKASTVPTVEQKDGRMVTVQPSNTSIFQDLVTVPSVPIVEVVEPTKPRPPKMKITLSMLKNGLSVQHPSDNIF